MNGSNLGMLRWREGDCWLVACEHFNVLTQGSTLDEAWERWKSAFALEALFKSKTGRVVEPPPQDVLKKWVLNDQLCTITHDFSFN